MNHQKTPLPPIFKTLHRYMDFEKHFQLNHLQKYFSNRIHRAEIVLFFNYFYIQIYRLLAHYNKQMHILNFRE